MSEPKLITADYRGTPIEPIDDIISEARKTSTCLVYEGKRYDRKLLKLVEDKDVCVVDFFDGDYMNFIKE
jgi:hypothetical protein